MRKNKILFLGFFLSWLAPLSGEQCVIKFDDFLKGGSDGFGAMSEIIERVKANNGAETVVEFSGGTYDFKKDPNHSWFFLLKDLENLTIDGKGSKLMIDSFNAYVRIDSCKNIAIKNFEFVHNRLAFTQGDIVDVTREYFVIKIDDGYDEPASEEFVKKYYPNLMWMWGSFMDREARTLKYGYPDHLYIDRVVPDGKPRHYRIYPVAREKNVLSMLEKGVAFVMPLHMEPNKPWLGGIGPYTISILNSSDILVENITARATRHAGWSGNNNQGKITFKNCVLTWRENSSDLISSWRDGSHFKNNKIGPAFIDCKWEGMLDDSINIGANPILLVEDKGEGIYKIHGGRLKKGSRIGIFYPNTGKWIEDKDLRVEEINQNVVKFSKPIPDAKLFKILSAEDILAGKKGINASSTQLYDMDYVSADFVVRNCEFGKQRRFAMIIRSPGGVIENNRIFGGTGIMLSNEVGSWYEGPLPKDVRVRRNTFEGVWGTAPLKISASLSARVKVEEPYNMRISDNVFKLTMPENKCGISISNGSGFTLRRNKYYNALGERIPESEGLSVSPFASGVDTGKESKKVQAN